MLAFDFHIRKLLKELLPVYLLSLKQPEEWKQVCYE